MWHTLWNGFKKIGFKIGAFQSRLLLALFYLIIIAPIALVFKLLADPLLVRKKTGFWLKRAHREEGIEELKRQF